MKLYQFPFAPNAAKVRLYLEEKRAAGCEIAVEEVTVNLREGEHKKPEYRAINPMGAVPALEIEPGRVIHESLPIIDYFEDLYPEPSMWGTDPASRAYARQIERIADIGVLIGAAREIHNTNSPLGLPPNPPVAAHYHERWEISIAFLENEMSDDRRFLAGDDVTIGDCTLQGILQFARIGNLPVLAGSPRLTAWCSAFRERDSAKATILV